MYRNNVYYMDDYRTIKLEGELARGYEEWLDEFCPEWRE